MQVNTLTPAKPSSDLLPDRHLAVDIGRNTAFGILSSAVQVGTRFVMVPIVIQHLGLQGYGIWSIIMATAGYMRFGSAGLKSAFQKYVAEATACGDFRSARQLLSTGSLSMLGLSVVGLVPLAFCSKALAHAAGVPAEFLVAAAGSITLLAVTMVLANFGAVFEAAVMGRNRIDVTRKFSILTIAGETVVIILLLHFGYGLFAMASTVALSELVYVLCCYLASRRIVPEIHISTRYFSTAVFRELLRFAGSYQLVNILELLYGLLVPVIVLRHFGAEIAGVYALVTRLVSASLIGLDALILPLLSGGAMVFASGSVERLNRFFNKSFKISLAITVLPLAFVAGFGTLLLQAWTGQVDPEFRLAIQLASVVGLFASVSRVQLILYRASGKALHDNIRQAFRLGVLVLLGAVASRTGFYGVLIGLAVAEFAGVIYMFFGMSSILHFFRPKHLIPDALRVGGTVLVMMTAGLLATRMPMPWILNERVAAILKTAVTSLVYVLAAWPAVSLTKAISAEEQHAVLDLLFRRAIPVRPESSLL
jgi:O-antigen/teichoic acid export membrane protein